MRTVAIHQPNFMPWYPFFQKMAHADVFVIMSHCQYEKNGYQNRFNMDNKWKTMSVYRGLDPINKKQYVNPQSDWQKIKTSMPEYSKQLREFDNCIQQSLIKTNEAIIRKIANLLNIKTEIVIDSPSELKSTERLVEICVKNGATEYLAGISGKKYLHTELFVREGIRLSYQSESDMIKKDILGILKNVR